MKRIQILITALVALCATSCVEGYEDTGFTPLDPVLSFEKSNLDANSSAQELTIKFSSNLPWMITSDASWMSATPSRGEAGENIEITVNLQRNRTVEVREGNLIASITKDKTCSLTVQQGAAEAGAMVVYYVSMQGTEENSGLSWSNATTLAKAIDSAADGDIIYVAEGSYAPTNFISGYNGTDEGYKTFELHSNFSLIGGFPADSNDDTFSAEKDYNPTAYPTTLCGTISPAANAYHVVTVTAPQNEGKKVILNGFTIRDGKSSEDATTIHSAGGNAMLIGYGAGMMIGKSNIDMQDVIITENTAGCHAAGIFSMPGAVINMENCHIRSNTSTTNAGGMWNAGSTLYMNNCTFEDNVCGQQAGAYYSIDEISGGYTISRIYNTSFTGNDGTRFKETRSGGACYLRELSDAIFVNCTFSGNKTSGYGGAVQGYGKNGKYANVQLINCTIVNNSTNIANTGGGVGVYNPNATINIYNSIVSGNPNGGDIGSGAGMGDSAPKIFYYNSIIGGSFYNNEMAVVPGHSFDVSTMLSALGQWSVLNSTYSYQLISGAGNPACTMGMSRESLVELGSGFSPVVEATVFDTDQRGVSRQGKNTIGANTFD